MIARWRSWSSSVAVVMLLAGCAQSAVPVSGLPSARPAPARSVNPANIARITRDLPPGYEVASAARISVPVTSWGLGLGATANPAHCLMLAKPDGLRDGSARGVSGSGAGGIIYAVVVAAASDSLVLDENLVDQCRQWIMGDGPTTASVSLVDSPHIEGVQTLGMLSVVTASVEGSAGTNCRAYTFVAYLDSYYAFSTLVTDPGSPQPPLTADFADDLLVKMVSALRS
ncbi:MAG: DUF5642 family protein [Mycobacteriaceae bacterium]|nr:DUF5642 family protein [Mycobacteriaceae bacterium]